MRKLISTLAKSAAKTLRERLKNEAIVNAERDLAIASEWCPLEEEVLERDLSRIFIKALRISATI